LVEEVRLSFRDERWNAPPVIEALFQGTLKRVESPPTIRRLTRPA
jgi:hypothetical protein